jgi:DNA-binding LacI/PurR family transcriptional regulator
VYLGPSPSLDSDIQDRWRGYEEAMLLSGLEPRRVDAGYDETLSALRPRLDDLLTSDVTAVAAYNDDLAVAMMRSAVTNGRRIGGDPSNSELAVVGFDNTEKAHIGLTSVRQPIEEISRHLAIALLETIRNRDRPHHVVLSCDLVVRDSTSKAVDIT